MREDIAAWLRNLQGTICAALEAADGQVSFGTDEWRRPEGGGGTSRTARGGAVIEKGGVLFSAVHGPAPAFLSREQAHGAASGKKIDTFFATGVSIVIHPVNPWVPIIHMNVRYFEAEGPGGKQRWLGGGIDLTPHYVIESDARFFHTALKSVCDKHHPEYYPVFSRQADEYFYLPHRRETRGIGGIFFDRLNEDGELSFEQNLQFWKDVGNAFAPIYAELMLRNRHRSFTADERQWQLLRRGRYVEFNLLYDKGTRFGLETNGRVESILMSLPALAAWEYDVQPAAGTPEAVTLSQLRKGIEWVS